MAVASNPLSGFRLDGKTVLITGASSGLGARFAGLVSAVGARPVLVARRADRLQAVAAEIPESLVLPCDISSPDAVLALVDAAQHYGPIDVLVNNAGISDGGVDAENESLEEFNQILSINLSAAFQLSQLVAQGMIERNSGGCIVNIASIHGLVAGAPNDQAAYAASKSALIGLTRELAVQWARFDIRVNAIAPAYFATELTADMFANERSRAWIERNTPMRRPGRIDELDGALLYLASDASSYVTGTTLVVDGGWTAR